MRHDKLKNWLLFSLLFSAQILAANSIFPDIALQEQSGKWILTASVNNQSSRSITITYHFEVKYGTGTNTSNNHQQDQLVIQANADKQLSTVSVSAFSDGYCIAILKIYDANQKFLVADTLIKGTVPNIDTKKISTIIKQAGATEEDAKDSGIEFEGFILDDTRTKTGRDFYDLFYARWIAPKGANYNLVIKELPPRGRLARISVELEGEVIYSRFMQPKIDVVEANVNLALRIAKSRMLRMVGRSESLDDDDLEGSGIF